MSSQPDDVLDEILVNLYFGANTTEKMPNWMAQMNNPELFTAEQAIKALIDEAVREARIDTLDDCYGYWHVNGGIDTGQLIKERMAELQKPTKGNV